MGAYDLDKTMPLRVVTFNIRYATSTPVAGEEPWEVRRPRLCAQLRFIARVGAGGGGSSSNSSNHHHHHNHHLHFSSSPTFFCLQECLAGQVRDVVAGLGPGWAHIGVGRDDGAARGEFSPVVYDERAWRCERSQTYWLSPTPLRPSRGWDAVLPRVVTMGQFAHRACGARVVVLSTHFDHRGATAREESARLILELTEKWVGEAASNPATTTNPTTIGGGREGARQQLHQRQQDHDASADKRPKPPVFLGGDFNSTPSDGAYRTMTAPGTGMTDVATLFPDDDRRYGNELTYSSFGEPGEVPKRIDFLFVRETAGIRFLTFGVLANRFDDGVFLSDHRAVVADVEVPVVGQHPGGGDVI